MDTQAVAKEVLETTPHSELNTMAKIHRIVGARRVELNSDHCEIVDYIAQELDVWA